MGTAVLLLVLEAVLFFAIWTRFSEQQRWVFHTYQVREEIDAIFSELKNAETAQRVYLLTGRDPYLEPFKQVVQVVAGRLNQLRKLTADNPMQQAHIEHLRSLMADRFAFLQQGIELRRTRGPLPALEIIMTGPGKETMDRIQIVIGAMKADELVLLNRRSEKLIAASRTMTAIMAAGAALLLIVLLVGSRAINRHIAERLRHEEVRSSLAAIVDSTGDAIIGRTLDDLIATWNPGAEKLYGYTAAEMIGQSISLLALDGMQAVLRRAEQGAPIENYETAGVAKDGRRIDVAMTISDVPNALGRRVAGSVIARDITARKEAERRLRSQAFILDQADDCFFIRDHEDRVTYWSQGSQRLYGWSQEEALGQVTYALLKTQFPTPLADIKAHLIAQGYWKGELLHTRRDGSVITVASNWTLQHEDSEQRLPSIIEISHDITELKRAEAMRALLSAIVTSSNNAVISNTLESIVTSWNTGAERLFGYRAEEAIGRHITFLIPPDRLAEETAILDHLEKGELVKDLETTRLNKNGQPVEVSLSASPVRDARGAIVGASKILYDIGERKQAEAARRESDETTSALLEAAAQGIIGVLADGTIAMINPMAESIFGYTREELLGAPLEILLPQHLRERHRAHREQYTADPYGRPMGLNMDLHGRRKDGSEFPIEVSLSSIETRRGTLSVSFISDITVRRQAETAIRRQAKLLDQAYEPILAWELDGPILHWNRGAAELYGYTPEEAIGRVSRDLLRTVHPRGVAEMNTVLARDGQWTGEIRQTTKDGREIVVESLRSVANDGQGKWAVLEAVRDVTDRKRFQNEIVELNATLERRVEERTAQLQESNRELEAFSYSVSHDLRAPLRAVEGLAKILLRDYSGKVLDESAVDYMNRMRAASQRMGQLIADLLGLSRLTRQEMKLQPVNLSQLADSILAEYRSREPQRSVTTEVQPGLVANADRNLARLALENLLGNAWKYTGKVSAPTIAFGAMEGQEQPAYFVRDNGAGFDMAHAGQLFAPFQRLHRADEFEGTGIGLATVQRIIRRHGGRVWAEAKPDQGAVFYFTLGGEA